MTTPTPTPIIQPYLFFEGRCEEALEFYRTAIGAEDITLMRFKESPDPTMCAPDQGDKIMHASFRIGEALIMASDGRCQEALNFQGFSLSLTVADGAEAERRFNALSEGGSIVMPLTPTFYASSFGMLADRFGVSWMIIVPLARL